VETSDKLFFINGVQLMFSSMNLTILLLPLEKLGLVDSWRISYDQKGTLEGMIVGCPEIEAVNSVIVVNNLDLG
jgi:hypothetical protein